MILLRSIVYFTFLIISTIFFGLLIAVLGWFLPTRMNSRMANSWGKVNLYLLNKICHLNYRIIGIENLIDGGNGIVLSKHQSAWETIALRGLLPSNQAWVLKRELMWVPIFGWALAVMKPIAIDRKSGRAATQQIITRGTESLEAGNYVIIFPEGTRVAPGERKRYGIGGSLLAEKSGYPVIPIAHNAGLFWRRRGLKKYPGTIDVVIGPRIQTKNKSMKEIHTEVEEWIENQVANLPGISEIKR